MNNLNQAPRVVLPGSTIGILGGGQLGRMMALDGRKLGYQFVVLDPTPNSPAGQVCDQQIVAPYHDVAAATRLAEQSDVITYEFENVDSQVASILEAESYVPQGSRLLHTTQHRLREKRAVEAAGAPVARHVAVDSLEGLLAGVDALGLPAVLKTTTGGYDGKGQWKIASVDDAKAAWSEWVEQQGSHAASASTALGAAAGSDDAPLVLEEFIHFVQELSVVVARNSFGQTVCFPVSENIHEHHILHLSIVPARTDPAIQRQALDLAERITVQLGAVGLLAVEMFLTADGRLFVNELAPRPHNSGHYTLDACATSQFEQHVRAVCGLPLSLPTLLSPVVMVNVLGQHVEGVLKRMPDMPGNVKVHLYGKAEAKTDRKMGHLNVLGHDVDEALETIQSLDIWN